MHDVAPRAHAAGFEHVFGGDAKGGSVIDLAGGEHTSFGSFFFVGSLFLGMETI